MAQLRQRRLNQPFAWHQDPDINEEVDNFSEEEVPTPGNGASHEKEKESSPSDVKIVPYTCRNSVQGQVYIADDRGNTKNCFSLRLSLKAHSDGARNSQKDWPI